MPSSARVVGLDSSAHEGNTAEADRTQSLLKGAIRSVPDFPIPGIDFKDITTLLARRDTFHVAIDGLCRLLEGVAADAVVAIESRGFILGAPIASQFRMGMVLVRKPGKLPASVDRFSYTCEYCSGVLEVHQGLIRSGDKCLIVDDLLATGGTARATADYVAGQGGEVVGYAFLVEIAALRGREKLQDAPVFTLLTY